MKNRNTITFEVESDLLPLVREIEKRGRGVRTRVINKALRAHGQDSLKAWDVWQSSAAGNH